MSFILDALRKSESERQREASPTLARAPIATVRRETPMWIWFVIGALSIALTAIGVGWWRTNNLGPGMRASVDADSASADVRPVEPSAPPGNATLRTSSPSQIDGPSQINGLSDTATPSQQPFQTATAAGEPKSIAELQAMDASLPTYALQFTEFNAADPSQGSAWINGSMYRPGERIGAGGPELVEIRSDNVILAYRGNTYRLRLR